MSLVAIEGENFSGRTELLRATARAAADGVYVGPEVHNYISALCASVHGEILLHQAMTDPLRVSTRRLVESLDLVPLLDCNPFELSGGQQAAVALVAASAMHRSIHSADSCLEQLDTAHRAAFVRWAADQPSQWLVADNRIDELPDDIMWLRRQRLTSDRSDFGQGLLPLALHDDCAMTSADPVSLCLQNVQFSYDRKRFVLKDVSLDLRQGLYVLDGPNGAGKSTLAKILAGVIKPFTGRIIANGRDIETWRSPGKFVGYHFQNPDLQLFSSSVTSELREGNRVMPEPFLMALACTFGLQQVLDAHPLDLPFVGRKRVAVAATMAMPSPWLVLDEPTLGQDASAMSTIAALIKSFVTAGRGVICVSHSTGFKERLGGTRIILEDGHATFAHDRQALRDGETHNRVAHRNTLPT